MGRTSPGTATNIDVSSVVVSGTVTANQGTPNTASNAWFTKITDGTDTALISSSGAVLIDGSATTQPVSGTVTANAGTNLNTSALLTTAAHDAAFGTAGTADAQVRSIQGIASMTPVQVSQATASTLNATVVGTGTFAVQDAAAEASLSVLDDWDETDRAKVNLIVGQAGIAAGTGVDGVTVPRVTLATNVALPTGTNSIGQVTANAGTNLNTSALLTSADFAAAFGTAGTADTQVISVQGIASMTPVQVSQATASNLNAQVVGSIASGATDSGNPVKMGGLFSSSPATITDGQRGNVQITGKGALHTNLVSSNSVEVTINTFGNNGGSTTQQGLYTISQPLLFNGTTMDAGRSIINATNSTGTGIQAVGLVAQFDDAAPTSITENQFGNSRMSANRNLYTTIRDAAGNERGLNVDTNGAIAATHASGAVASGAFASGSIASGAVASGAFASGSIAAGAIAVGAIAAGDTSIATTEDTARAGGEHLVKIGQTRLDVPVANAGVSGDNDYTNFLADNFGKTWVSGTVPEDTAHVAGEALTVQGQRRIDTLATSTGSSGDWGTANQSAEGGAWTTLAGTATPNGLLVGNFTSGDTYTALTNSAQAIKASAGNMYGYYIYNPNATATYVLIYNIAAASVTVGTSTATLVFCIPATSGANLMFPVPIPFSNAGWSIAAATTGGGNSAPSTALEAMIWYM